MYISALFTDDTGGLTIHPFHIEEGECARIQEDFMTPKLIVSTYLAFQWVPKHIDR